MAGDYKMRFVITNANEIIERAREICADFAAALKRPPDEWDRKREYTWPRVRIARADREDGEQATMTKPKKHKTDYKWQALEDMRAIMRVQEIDKDPERRKLARDEFKKFVNEYSHCIIGEGITKESE